MSSEKTTEAPTPQTLSEFQQQFAAAVLANMKESNDVLLAALKDQQARMEAATAELMQRFGSFTLPGAATVQTAPSSTTGGSGQPAAATTPPVPAGPT